MQLAPIALMSLVVVCATAHSFEDSPGSIPESTESALKEYVAGLEGLLFSGLKVVKFHEPSEFHELVYGDLIPLHEQNSRSEFSSLISGKNQCLKGVYHYEDRNPIEMHTAFDGNIYSNGSYFNDGDGVPANIVITQHSQLISQVEDRPIEPGHFDHSYLHAIGIFVPSIAKDLGLPAQSLILHGAQNGKIVSIEENGSLITITLEIPEPLGSKKTGDLVEYLSVLPVEWQRDIMLDAAISRRKVVDEIRVCTYVLDQELGMAVVQRKEHRKDGPLLVDYSYDEFTKLSTGIWVPNVVVETHYVDGRLATYISDIPIFDMAITLDSASPVSPGEHQELFSVKADGPGYQVTDYTSPEASDGQPHTYVVPPVAANIADVVEVNNQEVNRLWYLAILSLVIAAILVFYMHSQRNANNF